MKKQKTSYKRLTEGAAYCKKQAWHYYNMAQIKEDAGEREWYLFLAKELSKNCRQFRELAEIRAAYSLT